MPEIWRDPELPDAECTSDPIAGFHEQHRFLSFTDTAHGDRGQRLCFPVRNFEAKSAEPNARYHQKEVIGQTRLSDSPSKQHPIAAACKDKIGAFKRFPYCPVRELRIKVSDAVEPDQPGNNPVAPHVASAAHTRGIEVGRMSRVPITVPRITAEPSPPVTAEFQDLDQHH